MVRPNKREIAQEILANRQDYRNPVQGISLSEQTQALNFKKLGDGIEPDTQKATEGVADFFEKVFTIRRGENKTTKKKRNRWVSLSDAVHAFYGVSLYEFLGKFGIDQSDSLKEIASKLGHENLSLSNVQDWVTTYANKSFSDFFSTGDARKIADVIIPELMLDLIDLSYRGGAKHMAWVARTIRVSVTDEINVPYKLRGNTAPKIVKEGGKKPLGTLNFGKKKVAMKKVGIGFKFTDELISQSPLNILEIAIAEVGVEMAMKTDAMAMFVLVAGEQELGANAADIVGVNNTLDGFTQYDIDNIMETMAMLNKPANLVVGRKAELLRKLYPNNDLDNTTIRQYLQSPDNEVMVESWGLPISSQILFVNTENALGKLEYAGFVAEMDRDPATDTTYMYFKAHVGFFKMHEDACVVLDKSQNNVDYPVPTYMDMETILAENFSLA